MAGCANPKLPPIAQGPPEMREQRPAAEAPSETRPEPITLDQALQRASQCNPQLQALQAAVTVAKERKAAASDFEDPEALVAWGNIGDQFSSSTPVVNNNNNNNGNWRTGGRFYVPNPFLISPRVSARTADLLAAKADLQAARWGIECDIRRLFAQLAYLTEDIALAQGLASANGEILKDVRARAEQGAATASDLVAASQKQVETENALALSRHQYLLAQRELAGVLDLPLSQVVIATNDLRYPLMDEAEVAFEPLQQIALKCRGDLTALRWRALAARSSFTEARNARVPWFKEVNFWNREPRDQWWIGAAVTVPLFSWAKNHAQDLAQAQASLAGVNETNAMKLIRRELRDSLDEVVEQQRQQTRNQTQVLPLLNEMRHALQLMKATPNLMPSQVAATEAQILESSRIDLAARWRYHAALLNLERAVGEPLAEALETGTKSNL